MCVCSNSHNDVLRVAQRYGTTASHTRRPASILVVFVVFCVHMHSFAGLIRWTPPPRFSDTAIIDRHSDTTIFQLRAHWVQITWSIGSEKLFVKTLENLPCTYIAVSHVCCYDDSYPAPPTFTMYDNHIVYVFTQPRVNCFTYAAQSL